MTVGIKDRQTGRVHEQVVDGDLIARDQKRAESVARGRIQRTVLHHVTDVESDLQRVVGCVDDFIALDDRVHGDASAI